MHGPATPTMHEGVLALASCGPVFKLCCLAIVSSPSPVLSPDWNQWMLSAGIMGAASRMTDLNRHTYSCRVVPAANKTLPLCSSLRARSGFGSTEVLQCRAYFSATCCQVRPAVAVPCCMTASRAGSCNSSMSDACDQPTGYIPQQTSHASQRAPDQPLQAAGVVHARQWHQGRKSRQLTCGVAA
jgi:hypothetical protein